MSQVLFFFVYVTFLSNKRFQSHSACVTFSIEAIQLRLIPVSGHNLTCFSFQVMLYCLLDMLFKMDFVCIFKLCNYLVLNTAVLVKKISVSIFSFSVNLCCTHTGHLLKTTKISFSSGMEKVCSKYHYTPHPPNFFF